MAAGRWCVLPTSIAMDLSLSMSEFRIMVIFSVHAKKSGWCKLKLETIAEESGLSGETARKVVRRLEGKGYLEKVRHRTYCDYRIICDRDEETGLEEDRSPETSQDRSPETSQDRYEDTGPYRTGSVEQVKENNITIVFDDFWKEWIKLGLISEDARQEPARKIWETDFPDDQKADAIAGIPGFQRWYRVKTPDTKINMLGAKRFIAEEKYQGFCDGKTAGTAEAEIDPNCPHADQRRKLAAQVDVGPAIYNVWLKDMRIDKTGDRTTIFFKSAFFADYARRTYIAPLERVFGNVRCVHDEN